MGERSVVHSFSDSLAFSHSCSDLPIWEEVYKKAFGPDCVLVDHRQDGEHQRAGIDRSVILPNSKQILIDEKARGRNKITGKVYDDILLEYVSNDRTGAPGWVCKPLRCDYIAYAITPASEGRLYGICHLLPVVQLQKAWKFIGPEWVADAEANRNGKRVIRAKNPGYNTLSVAVKPSELYPEIGKCLRVTFEAFEFEES